MKDFKKVIDSFGRTFINYDMFKSIDEVEKLKRLNDICYYIHYDINRSNPIDLIWEAIRRNVDYQNSCKIYIEDEKYASYYKSEYLCLQYDVSIHDIRKKIKSLPDAFIFHPLVCYDHSKPFSSLPAKTFQKIPEFIHKLNTLPSYRNKQERFEYFFDQLDDDMKRRIIAYFHNHIIVRAKDKLAVLIDPYSNKEDIRKSINKIIDNAVKNIRKDTCYKNMIHPAEIESKIEYLERYDELVDIFLEPKYEDDIVINEGAYEKPDDFEFNEKNIQKLLKIKYLKKLLSSGKLNPDQIMLSETLLAQEKMSASKKYLAFKGLSAQEKLLASEILLKYNKLIETDNLITNEIDAYDTAFTEAKMLIRAAPDIKFKPEARVRGKNKNPRKKKE